MKTRSRERGSEEGEEVPSPVRHGRTLTTYCLESGVSCARGNGEFESWKLRIGEDEDHASSQDSNRDAQI